ncbi:MAG: hypothetical protein NT145_07580 [Elusimicrobia bacterium]|nr:hypothetical protein [Elusimicrobiota bacterium]
MEKFRFLSAILLSVLILTPSFALAKEDPVFIRGVRPLAMGGAFVALADDKNAFFYNPAGITQRTGSEFTLFELPVSITNDSLNFYQYYNDNKDKLENFDKLNIIDKNQVITDINNKITKYKTRITLGFPNFSYLTPGKKFLSWGIGVFDEANVGFQFRSGILIPNLNYWGKADVIGAVPLAHRFDSLPYNIPGKISVGANVKYIMRGKIDETKSVLELDNISPQLQMGNGMGFDIGTLYQPNSRWNFGLQITDLGGTTLKYDAVNTTDPGKLSKPAYNSMINSEWNMGTAFIPSKIYYWPKKYINTKDRILLLADVRDILSSEERVVSDYFWKKLHLGAEFRWGPLSLRGGFNSGYPTLGLGARIPYLGLRADYAYWTDELGAYAGQIAETNHRISIALSWGDSKGRAYGKDVKAEQEQQKAAAVEPKKEEIKPNLASGTTAQAVVPSFEQAVSTSTVLVTNISTTTVKVIAEPVKTVVSSTETVKTKPAEVIKTDEPTQKAAASAATAPVKKSVSPNKKAPIKNKFVPQK